MSDACNLPEINILHMIKSSFKTKVERVENQMSFHSATLSRAHVHYI